MLFGNTHLHFIQLSRAVEGDSFAIHPLSGGAGHRTQKGKKKNKNKKINKSFSLFFSLSVLPMSFPSAVHRCSDRPIVLRYQTVSTTRPAVSSPTVMATAAAKPEASLAHLEVFQ
jgi:hypothetical protein